MPDDEDYRHLAEMLADPLVWSDRDAEAMRSTLAEQRRAVAEAHPLDHKRLRGLEEVADQIESALRHWDERTAIDR